jgi:hypothetical protein
MYFLELAYVLHISKKSFLSISIDWATGFFFERFQLNENNWSVLNIFVTQIFTQINKKLRLKILCGLSHKNIIAQASSIFEVFGSRPSATKARKVPILDLFKALLQRYRCFFCSRPIRGVDLDFRHVLQKLPRIFWRWRNGGNSLMLFCKLLVEDGWLIFLNSKLKSGSFQHNIFDLIQTGIITRNSEFEVDCVMIKSKVWFRGFTDGRLMGCLHEKLILLFYWLLIRYTIKLKNCIQNYHA